MRGIRFRAHHGVTRAERGLAQDFIVDVDMDLPVSVLPRRDELRQVFDYDKVSTVVVGEGTSGSYRLLETLAQRLASRLLEETPALSATVEIRKMAPPTTASVEQVSVEVRLDRQR
ncbi:dihydroneopterin aldolase [Labilithrix luteola]|nr:dihydroneopterin aldolase [Labilithrix luteola]